MKKRIILACAAFLGAAVYGASGVQAAAPATAGQTIATDYVMVVNTNTDPENIQSTGILHFDADVVSGYSVQQNPLGDGAAEVMASPLSSTPAAEAEALSQPRLLMGGTYSIGTKKYIYQKDYTCIGIGERCYVWMEDGMLDGYTAAGKVDAVVQEMIRVYEGRPYEVLMTLAKGNIPYADGSGKLSILLEDTGGSAGFFAGETDITALHIGAPAADRYYVGALEGKNGLLVHEGHHALYNKLACGGSALLAHDMLWLNEGMAVAAMDYAWGGTDPTGWLGQINNSLMLRNGIPLRYSDYRGAAVADYSLPYLYVRYLAAQKEHKYDPIAFLQSVYEVSAVGKTQEQYINEVLRNAGFSLTFQETLGDFYAAAFSQAPTGSQGFYKDQTVLRQVTSYPLYQGESGKAVSLAGTAAIVVKTKNGSFTVPTDGGEDIRYYAVDRPRDVLRPAAGSGTDADPFQINSPDGLAALGVYTNASFVMSSDIDMTGIIHFATNSFDGKLDGGGYTIRGLNSPLFYSTTNIVENLNIVADFKGDYSDAVGMITRYQYGGVISNCSVDGTVQLTLTGSKQFFDQRWGAIAGYQENNARIQQCRSAATMTITLPANAVHIGGLVGDSRGGLENSYFSGTLTVKQPYAGSYTTNVGGLAGYVRPQAMGSYMRYCYSTGEVAVDAGGIAAGQLNVGRLLGKEFDNGAYSVVSTYGLSGMNMAGTSAAMSNANSKTAAELKTKSTFTDWLFGAVWKLEENAYPVFVQSDDIKTLEAIVPWNELFIGEKLSLINATLKINNSGVVTLRENMLVEMDSWDSSKAGTVTVKGVYLENPFSFQITIKKPTSVSDITVMQAGKTNYIEGASYSADGVVLSAKLNGSSYDTYIYGGFTHNAPASLTLADTTVEYTYEGARVQQSITVAPKTITGITTLASPEKTAYADGNLLSLVGSRFQVTYDDGSKSPVFTPDKLAEYGFSVAKLPDGEKSAVLFDLATPLAVQDNNAAFYVYRDKLPHEANSINSQVLESVSVQSEMFLPDETFYFSVGMNDGYGDGTTLVGGNGEDYSSKRIEGTVPAWLGVSRIGAFGSTAFSFWANSAPTTLGTTVLKYEVTDNVSNSSIVVTYTIHVVNKGAEADILTYKIRKDQNKTLNLKEDVEGIIDGTSIKFYLPLGTNLSNISLEGTSSRGAQAEPWLNGSVNLSSPKTYVITSEDGRNTKAYTVEVVLVDVEALEDLKTAIAQAQSAGGATVSTNGEDVPPSAQWVSNTAKTTLQAVIEGAIALTKSESPDAAAMRDKITALTNAVAAYNAEKQYGADITDAKASLVQVQAAAKVEMDNTPVSTDGAEVLTTDKWITSSAKSALQEKIATAESSGSNVGATKASLLQAKADLQAALDTFIGAKQNGTKSEKPQGIQLTPTVQIQDGVAKGTAEVTITPTEAVEKQATILLATYEGNVLIGSEFQKITLSGTDPIPVRFNGLSYQVEGVGFVTQKAFVVDVRHLPLLISQQTPVQAP